MALIKTPRFKSSQVAIANNLANMAKNNHLTTDILGLTHDP